MSTLHRAGQHAFGALGSVLDSGFGAELNPLRHLGALTIYFFWIVLISGIWLFIFFRTSVVGAYESVEYLTNQQWYLGGVMRSLHRYASDAAIITIALHILKEFFYDRYRSNRWFSWVTGVPLLWLVFPLGITGYWLVWDQLAWYVAITSAELLDWLPVFTDPMAGNFLSDDVLSDRFFTLMAFLHLLGLPLFLVFGIWLHVLRISGPKINPPRKLMAGSLLAMLALSFVFPAVSQGQVDLTRNPQELGLDWYYLLVYPLMKTWSPGWVWGLLTGFSLLLCAVPWVPPSRRRAAAEVDLDNCNGCKRCADDCPFGAVMMAPRSDGKSYEVEAVVDPALCMSCGICVGACPTATPFRKRAALSPGIDLPDQTAADLRAGMMAKAEKLSGDRRIIVFACAGGADRRRWRGPAEDERTAVVDITCTGHLPPSFIDFALSRNLADGIVLAGCSGGDCQYRLGSLWTTLRLGRQRDPHLRKRVDASRIAQAWQEPWAGYRDTAVLVSAFRETLPGGAAPPADESAAAAAKHPWRTPVAVAAYGAFALIVGWLSVWPRFQLIESDEAVVSLSFDHAGQRIGECRELTQEELNELPPNMRNPKDCPRERRPIQVVFGTNGETLYEASVPPTGFWNDGEASVYRRIPVPAGHHRLFIGMNDSGRTDGLDYESTTEVELEPGRHLVVAFDHINQEFVLK